MKGNDAIEALKRKFELNTDKELAAYSGMTIPNISLWKKREAVTARQFSGLVAGCIKAAERRAQVSAIRPLVEFFKLDKRVLGHGPNYKLFSAEVGKEGKNNYLNGLQAELDSNHGVYVFFDSRGHSIYVGKARKQSLWKEMTNVFNRDRDEVQQIKRVRHPSRQQAYKTNEEKTRQITRCPVPLHEMAVYFSAYKVSDGMINEVEAMLVRSFANDLLNVRMERFESQRKKKKSFK